MTRWIVVGICVAGCSEVPAERRAGSLSCSGNATTGCFEDSTNGWVQAAYVDLLPVKTGPEPTDPTVPMVLHWTHYESPTEARIWNPATGTFFLPSGEPPEQPPDLLGCSGQTVRSDGRLVVTGSFVSDWTSNLRWDSTAFPPSWERLPDYANPIGGRYYPSGVTMTLLDGELNRQEWSYAFAGWYGFDGEQDCW